MSASRQSILGPPLGDDPVAECSNGQTRAATQLAGEAATPPAPPAQPQREEPAVDATEEAGGPPQRKERHRQRRTYPPGDDPERGYLAG